VNEPQFSEAIHEEINSRPGSANHFCQDFLTYFGNYRLGILRIYDLADRADLATRGLFISFVTRESVAWKDSLLALFSVINTLSHQAQPNTVQLGTVFTLA
jgi:hypothetical protein